MTGSAHQVTTSTLLRLLERAPSTTVCVIGDLMLDEWILGEAHTVSPEAPVPVVAVGERRRSLGGAANVARVVAALGATASVVGVVGDDAAGRSVRAILGDAAIGADGVVTDLARPTTHKTRVVAGNQQIVRFDAEVAGPAEPATVAALVDRLRRMAPVDAFVVSDYRKGVVSDALMAEMFVIARRWGAVVVVDPKDPAVERFSGADVIKVNRREFEAASERAGLPGATLASRAAAMRERLDAGTTVVTVGGDGMVVATEGAAPVELPGYELGVFDVTGAGDVVAGIMALALAAGLEPIEAAGLANVAAAVSVAKPGTATVSATELVDRVVTPGSVGAMTRAELAANVDAWRLAGHRIVFTNGCFDLFHVGHLDLIRRAAALGDRLVVAVDTDESVRRLKGPGRPLVTDAARTAILAALDIVDAVVTFDDDLVELIDSVAPDVLVKGADYEGREVVGRSIVEATGGSVVLVPLLDGHSTTAMVNRMRAVTGQDR